MPTDSFSIAWAGPVARTSKGVSGGYMDASELVDAIANTLKAGGWSEIERTYARQQVFIFEPLVPLLGEPLPPELRGPTGCEYPAFSWGAPQGCSNSSGDPIVAWDSGRALPPTDCEFFELAHTAFGSAVSLAGKITFVTPMDAAATYDAGKLAIELRAKNRGTGMNGFCTYGDRFGNWAVTSPLWGGGYKLRSQTYNGTYIELVVTATGEGSATESVRLDWAVNSSIALRDKGYPSPAGWPVASGQAKSFLYTWQRRSYTIWACPYQMAVWASDLDRDSVGAEGSTACLASIPRVPVEHPGYGQAVILPGYYMPLNRGGTNQRTAMTWDPVLVSVGSALQYTAPFDAGIAGPRLPSYPLLNAEGKPLLHNPYVWTRYGAASGIIGQLWNSVLVSSDEFPRDATMQWDGQQYLCMSKQSGPPEKTAGGLWLAVN